MQTHLFEKQNTWIDSTILYIKDAVDKHPDIARIGLSGGNTPKAIYEALAQQTDIDFAKIEFYLVDERYVPADHEHSNQRMIRETLLSPLRHKQGGFHYPDTKLPIADAVFKYDAELAAIPQLDMVLLGIGAGGHTASLFAGDPAATNEEKLVVRAHNPLAPNPPIADRITMTFRALLEADRILLLARGAEKKPLLDELLHGSTAVESFPAKRLLEHTDAQILHLQ